MTRETKGTSTGIGCLGLFVGFPVLASWTTDITAPFAQLAVFTPYATVALLVVALFALYRRWWIAGTAVLVPVLVSAFLLAPRVAGEASEAPGRRIVVMTVNIQVGGADIESLMEAVRKANPDVLAAEELTPDAQAGLDAAGFGQLFPHRVLRPEEGVSGMGLYSKWPLDGGAELQDGSTFPMPGGDVRLDGFPVRFQAVHAYPPLPGAEGTWRKDLAALRAEIRRTKTPMVYLGDFNATADHPSFRKLLGTGLRDAHELTGRGLAASWPSGMSLVLIDHVLVSKELEVVSVHEQKIRNSDHLALVAELTLPAVKS